MGVTCSHVLLKVNDLHQAVNDFRALGFVVDYAAAEKKALHAHIWFTEGPIIELLATPKNAGLFKWPLEIAFGRGAGGRMVRWARQDEGFCDLAMVVDTPVLADPVRRLREHGIPSGRPVRWKRTKPDGSHTAFQFAYPRQERLPFMVTAYDPPQHPATINHPNGATGLRTVRMAVRAEDRPAFDLITAGDPTISVEDGETTGVRAIELSGLRSTLDPKLLHGAPISPAGALLE